MVRKKMLVLLAGSPGTGKSYLLSLLKTRFPDLFALTPDEIKECYAESLGFDSLAEKAQIEKQYVWPFYYQALGLYMSLGKRLVVSEYPFSEKQKPLLTFLAQSYGYDCLTIRLTASFETLWERRYLRDRADDRHLSFIMERYHYGDVLEDRQAATNHITKEAFRQIITDRRYDDFQLGALIEVNVEDYEQVDYRPLIERIAEQLNDLN
ncbi:zeta toxin family protein [Enterococcus casseliflavus]|uniref:zeta toxin family protein n=1 Tax=Enterococcus casseliflavus TaxID=37734 RepID=UPI0022DEEF3B|nr:zeta toxin family protein [Enterococcus casseliflavus]